MSDPDASRTPETSDDLGPKPDAVVEPAEPNPGGADAIEDGDGVHVPEAGEDPMPRDLDPSANPAVEDSLPDDVRQGDDTSTEATTADADGSSDVSSEGSTA